MYLVKDLKSLKPLARGAVAAVCLLGLGVAGDARAQTPVVPTATEQKAEVREDPNVELQHEGVWWDPDFKGHNGASDINYPDGTYTSRLSDGYGVFDINEDVAIPSGNVQDFGLIGNTNVRDPDGDIVPYADNAGSDLDSAARVDANVFTGLATNEYVQFSGFLGGEGDPNAGARDIWRLDFTAGLNDLGRADGANFVLYFLTPDLSGVPRSERNGFDVHLYDFDGPISTGEGMASTDPAAGFCEHCWDNSDRADPSVVFAANLNPGVYYLDFWAADAFFSEELGAYGFRVQANTNPAIPLPPAVWMLGAGVSALGLFGLRRRRGAAQAAQPDRA